MTRLNTTPASIYREGVWTRGHVEERDGVLTDIVVTDMPGPPEPPYLIPGFVDLHVHGGGGGDVMDGPDGVGRTAQFHAGSGTVAICATTVTAPPADITAALRGIAHVVDQPVASAAVVLGAHIEGPFVNPAKLGGQPPFAIDPDVELARSWCDLTPVRIVTLAPELHGAEALIRFLAGKGVRVQVGHSLADDETLSASASWGVSGVAHLFNASAPITSRQPGVAGWALGCSEWAELICDLKHVHPTLLKLAIRSISNPYFVTDCCAAGGCPDGEYRLGRGRITKHDGLVCLPGTNQIAASLLVGIEAFRNILSLGVGLEEAVRMTSERPARYVGAKTLGAVAPGRAASVVMLDERFSLVDVWIEGKRLQ